jgi:hypothetical protein
MIRSYGPGSIFIPYMYLTMILMNVRRMVYHAPRELTFSGKNGFLNKSGAVPTSYSKQEPEVDTLFPSGSNVSSQDPEQQLTKAGEHLGMEGAGGNYI